MHVPKGAIYGLVGKNGAGKTTLIRLICGLQTPTSGTYELYGIDSRKREISSSRRRMGAVIETPAIYMDMTAHANLKMQYQVLGLPSEVGISELLKLVGLEHTGNKKAKNFSLGMRQRLGIAIALAGDPDFLVLDEPINGLDPEGIIEIRELILKLNKEHQITVLLSSHMLDELSRVATHYGFTSEGRIVKEISAAELEAACEKCIRIKVTDTVVLARTLDGLGIPYKIFSGTEADVFAALNVTQLALTLAKDNCEILSLQERDESLESYYVNLIGGAGHDEITLR
jgi:ABC-2 type transport system ATP-binding protein